MPNLPFVSRALHQAILAEKDTRIRVLQAMVDSLIARAEADLTPAPAVAPAPAPVAPPPAPLTFGKATELAILEQAAGNKQLESHLRAVAQGLTLQGVEDKAVARTIRQCETTPRTIAQVVASAAGDREDAYAEDLAA